MIYGLMPFCGQALSAELLIHVTAPSKELAGLQYLQVFAQEVEWGRKNWLHMKRRNLSRLNSSAVDFSSIIFLSQCRVQSVGYTVLLKVYQYQYQKQVQFIHPNSFLG